MDIIRTLKDSPDSGPPMPAIFVGHGSPMNAIEDNEFSRGWAAVGKSLPRPKAILCISAHWETFGTHATAMEHPRTIHDFRGFPAELRAVEYPAPGAPEIARLARETARKMRIVPDFDWGLDHGAWSVLCRMFPLADVPVVQLSLDRTLSPASHYELGSELQSLRRKGVMIVGSGNIVHNLNQIVWQDTAFDWAREFDRKVKEAVLASDHASLIDYSRLGAAAGLSVPTAEHYLPLLYILAQQGKGEDVRFFAEKVTLGSISMTSLVVG